MNRRVASVLALILTLWATSSFAQTKKTAPAKAAPKTSAQPAALDLNSASKADLMMLPGISDADAQRIIDGRPYQQKDQLVGRNIISVITYGKIKDRIVVKAPKK